MCVLESRSGLLARLVQTVGQRRGLFGCFREGCFRLGDLLVAVDDGCELCGAAVAQGDQLRFVRRAVFLLQGDQRVEPRRALRQPLGVGIEPFACGGGRTVDVLQFLQYRAQPSGIFPGGGVVAADMVEFVLRILELRQHPGLVGVEGVAQGGQRLADAVGVFEHRQLLLQLCLLTGAQVGRGEFLGLEPEPLFVAAAVGGLFAQGREMAAQLRKPGILRGVLRQQFPVRSHGVERRGPELLRREDQVLVLRVDVQQACAQFAQLRQLHGYVVDEGAALARRGDHARQGRFGGIVEVVLGEKRFQAASREVEGPLHRAVARCVLHRLPVVLGSEQQAQRAEQNGFSGPGLTRDDVQVGVQLHFELVDERVVFDRQTA